MTTYCKGKNCDASTMDHSGFEGGLCDTCWEKSYTCSKCGGKEFSMKEITYWYCEVDSKGTLDCSGATNDDCVLTCMECETEKDIQDFNDIDYR